MLALEIKINDGKPLVVGADILFVSIDRIETRDNHSLLAFGANDSNHYRWLDEHMQVKACKYPSESHEVHSC